MVLVSAHRSSERPRLGSSSAPSRPSASRRVPRLESPSRGHHRPVEHVSHASDAGKGTLVEGDREGTITIAFAPHLYETTAELSSEHRFVTACSREDRRPWLISRGAEMTELINLGAPNSRMVGLFPNKESSQKRKRLPSRFSWRGEHFGGWASCGIPPVQPGAPHRAHCNGAIHAPWLLGEIDLSYSTLN